MSLFCSMTLPRKTIQTSPHLYQHWGDPTHRHHNCLIKPLFTYFLPSKLIKQSHNKRITNKNSHTQELHLPVLIAYWQPWISKTAFQNCCLSNRFLSGISCHRGLEPVRERLVLFWVLPLAPEDLPWITGRLRTGALADVELLTQAVASRARGTLGWQHVGPSLNCGIYKPAALLRESGSSHTELILYWNYLHPRGTGRRKMREGPASHSATKLLLYSFLRGLLGIAHILGHRVGGNAPSNSPVGALGLIPTSEVTHSASPQSLGQPDDLIQASTSKPPSPDKTSHKRYKPTKLGWLLTGNKSLCVSVSSSVKYRWW